MKILIVNAYDASDSGKKAFAEFQFIIQQKQTDQQDTETDFYIRNYTELDEFLYDPQLAYSKSDNGRQFDLLDIIFMQGNSTSLPWHPKYQKVMILLRMCIKSNKQLFASSFLMSALVYITATNLKSDINIINGKNYGGGLISRFLTECHKQLIQITQSDYFLDRVTGDLYNYSYETNELTAAFNIGLHYEKATQDYPQIGKYILKQKVFKDNAASKCRYDESLCQLKKQYLNHWATKGLPLQFIVPSKNKWCSHPFIARNQDIQFIVLVESDRGAVIINHENYIGAQFEITHEYPILVNFLEIFIKNKLSVIIQMQNNKSHSNSILQYKLIVQPDYNVFLSQHHKHSNSNQIKKLNLNLNRHNDFNEQLNKVDKQRSQTQRYQSSSSRSIDKDLNTILDRSHIRLETQKGSLQLKLPEMLNSSDGKRMFIFQQGKDKLLNQSLYKLQKEIKLFAHQRVKSENKILTQSNAFFNIQDNAYHKTHINFKESQSQFQSQQQNRKIQIKQQISNKLIDECTVPKHLSRAVLFQQLHQDSNSKLRNATTRIMTSNWTPGRFSELKQSKQEYSQYDDAKYKNKIIVKQFKNIIPRIDTNLQSHYACLSQQRNKQYKKDVQSAQNSVQQLDQNKNLMPVHYNQYSNLIAKRKLQLQQIN